jgi:hypothetical protein
MHATFVQHIHVSHMTSIHYAWVAIFIFWPFYCQGFDKHLLNDRFSETSSVLKHQK